MVSTALNSLKIAGAAADGVIVGTPWFPNKDDQKVKDFRKAYKDKIW